MVISNRNPKQESSNPAVVRIEGTPEGPRLYTGNVRPGGRVVLMAEASVGDGMVTVTFAGGATPLAGVAASFALGPGAPVEFTVAQIPDDHYPFVVEAAGNVLLEARLAVSADGTLEKTGFVFRAGSSASALLLFRQVSKESTVDVEVDTGSQGATGQVAIRETGGKPEVFGAGVRSIPVTGVGCVATLYFSPGSEDATTSPAAGNGDGGGQTGGTEQVEIVIDPDGGGG